MKPLVRPTFFVVSSLLLIAGCETPTRLDNDYGNAYRNMVAQQIHDPHAAANPPSEPPMTLDGQRASGVIDKYRRESQKKQDSVDTLSIQLGK
jgi:type IV pilus biogenesis protein CpaD/CtpE